MQAEIFDVENYGRTVAAYYGLPDISIRTARREDFQRLTRIQVSALLASSQFHDDKVQAYVGRHLRQTKALCGVETFYVATTRDGSVVGCGGWTWVEGGQDNIPCAVGFYVDPQHGKRGIGRSLLAVTEASARRHGVSTIAAFAPLIGTDLFRLAGYSAGDVVPFDLGDGTTIEHLVLRKRLNL
jgi:N-acetylglutamate synthase-like GNAT family acetyltransferase